MSEDLEVRSHKGTYRVSVGASPRAEMWEGTYHVLVDSKVLSLHQEVLAPILAAASSVVEIQATEEAKSLEEMPKYVATLAEQGARRGHSLLCIGGGILQDITCFLSAVLYRGLPWDFIPTTLLAQADSCIGSKSSINVSKWKNIVGTYTPPRRVAVWPGFLDTLEDVEIRSGLGEMLKVHAIAGPAAFDEIASDYEAMLRDRTLLLRYVRRSLEIKKELIEADEFDEGVRLVLNYGHSFGHAIESATRFGIPHGIAITIGMDLANFVASQLGRAPMELYQRMHPALRSNYRKFEEYPIDSGDVALALMRDKKNEGQDLRFLLPNSTGEIELVRHRMSEDFRATLERFLTIERST